MAMPPAAVVITSFGYLHGPPPAAHITLDLRDHFRDPHVSPELRYLTARDEPVRRAVLATPGIPHLVDAAVSAVTAYRAGPSAGPVTVAVGCAGRHRAATVAEVLAARLGASVTHRDLDKAVVDRASRSGDPSRPRCGLPRLEDLTPSESDRARARDALARHTGIAALSAMERRITEVAVDLLAWLDLADTEGLARCIRRIRALLAAGEDAEMDPR